VDSLNPIANFYTSSDYNTSSWGYGQPSLVSVDKAGKILPVVITYYSDKSYDFVIKTPPAAVQLMEIAKAKKGSAEPNRKKVAEVTWDQIKTIAEDKMPDLNCFTIESAMTMIAGTARSMGITVKGEFPGK
jgi:large subunit ribosomal protein L11